MKMGAKTDSLGILLLKGDQGPEFFNWHWLSIPTFQHFLLQTEMYESLSLPVPRQNQNI
jgi:hypothetical protein